MSQSELRPRLDRPVNDAYDHILGPSNAPITLVEYGSYACPHCRAANSAIVGVRNRLGDRMRYVFRHRPIAGELARRSAELAEFAKTPEQFWKAHITLMTRSEALTEDDLNAVAKELEAAYEDPKERAQAAQEATERVEADIKSAESSGVRYTPTFFINGRRYDGPWDEISLADAMLGSLGHRVRSAAVEFANWAPSAGVLLLIASVLAVVLVNSPFGAHFVAFWEQHFGFTFGNSEFRMTLRDWVNDGLLTIFFLVVGLEIKREFTIGHLSTRRSAAFPIAAAIGGMTIPALLYAFIIPSGPLSHGWGIPIATDTAFAVALIIMMGRRVPVELRIFLTASAIVDDIGAILVVAAFYSEALHVTYLLAAALIVGTLIVLNRSGVYKATPYVLLGVILWICISQGGLHATLTGVLLALFIPTRPPPDLKALTAQANLILLSEAKRGEEVLRYGPSAPALRALDDIHDRLESPADRMLRHLSIRSNYFVLPIFALANAGVAISTGVITEHARLISAIMAGLVLGKPLGYFLASALAVRLGIAAKPDEYSWQQLLGAGALGGIGFTMSLFIAGQAFPAEADFAAAKIAVFSASILSAIIGFSILWNARNHRDEGEVNGESRGD
jgi:NhaA family Na+:H+ antiporter